MLLDGLGARSGSAVGRQEACFRDMGSVRDGDVACSC